MPALRFDHAQVVLSLHLVKVITLANDRFEPETSLIDQFVPIEGIDDLEVSLTQLNELLLQFSLHPRDAAAFEIGQILRDDFGPETRARVMQEVTPGGICLGEIDINRVFSGHGERESGRTNRSAKSLDYVGGCTVVWIEKRLWDCYHEKIMRFRLVLCLFVSGFLNACIHSMPTAEKLDELERSVREEYREEFADLDAQRRSGQLSTEQYKVAQAQLEKRVQNRVDTMAWNRHALVQSDMKANAIPTPDRPQALSPPGVGSISGSVYNSTRQNGIGNEIMGSYMQDIGNRNFNGRSAGSMYDQP